MKGNTQDNIKVFIRIRPFNAKQANTGNCINSFDVKSMNIKDKEGQHRFTFDYIFGMDTEQKQVYDHIGRQIVNSAFEGFNGTIFAYGQTSSGKTHTCIGPDYDDPSQKGILPRLICEIFEKISTAPNSLQFRIKISMVEIYMEKVKDLFDSSKNDLRIRQSKSKGIYLQDVTEEYVASAEQTISLVKKGIINRSVGQTNMNDASSRSHMAFIITLYQNDLKDSSAKSGKIILVDLAGSEKVAKTGAQGKLLDQAKNINKSLSALGNVINSLTQSKVSHIPYRDSKLTRLLQESLGGNSKTNLIINVSPSQTNAPETLSSLRFGFRAKQIKNRPKINKQYTVAELLLLLEKAQKKNQQLQVIIKELTQSSSKRKIMAGKKQAPAFVQNLLDSQNPLSNAQDIINDTIEQKKKPNQSLIYSDARYETQYNSDQEQTPRKPVFSPKKQLQLNQTALQERALLVEQIESLNSQKIAIERQYQIYKDKYQFLLKQAKITHNKLTNQQRQNQKLISKFIAQQLQKEEKQQKIMELQKNIQQYQENLEQLTLLGQKSSFSKIFGNQMSKEASLIMSKMKNINNSHDSKRQQNDNQDYLEKHRQQNKSIAELQQTIKKLQQQLILFKHLQNSKESFIKQRLAFSSQKQRVYQDLQNRIEKVLSLEEQLDQLKDKNKFLQGIIDSDESEKGRKLLILQRNLQETSQNYYVLKGQQGSWKNNNKKFQQKLNLKEKKIRDLQNEVRQLKEDLQLMKIKNDDFDDDNESILNIELQDGMNSQEKRQGRIVKVIKPSQIKIS